MKPEGRGPADMNAVVGAKDAEVNKVIAKTLRPAGKAGLQGFVAFSASSDANACNGDVYPARQWKRMSNKKKTIRETISVKLCRRRRQRLCDQFTV